MTSKNPLPAIAAIIFSVLFLVSLAARFWTSDAAYDISGPTHIAGNDERLFLYLSGEVVQLSPEGKLVAHHGKDETGLSGHPIDLRLLADGGLLIAEQRPARVRICDTAAWICTEEAMGSLAAVERQLKVLPDESGSGWLVTDSRGDTLWALPLQGGEAEQLLAPGTLAGPNDMAFDEKGGLWIADTDHRRIVELRLSLEGLLEPGREHPTVNELTLGERWFPIMLAMDDEGNIWVTQATEFSDKYADVVIYHPEDGVSERVELPGAVFAADIVFSGNKMLVTDLETFQVFAIDTKTREVEVFGDPGLISLLTGLMAKRDRYLQVSRWSMAAIILFALLAITAASLASPKRRRWTQRPGAIDLDSAPEAAPLIKGIYWLERDPRMERTIKLMEPLAYVVIGLTVAGVMGLFAWLVVQAGEVGDAELQEKVKQIGLILVLTSLVMAGLVLIVRLSLRAMKRRLGTDGRNLHIRLNSGREIAVPPENLAFNGMAILYRQYSLPLQTGKRQNIYRAGEVETYLVPLLRNVSKLNAWQSLRHQWKHRDAVLVWMAIYISATAVMAAIFAVWMQGFT
jgi:hypothetical protein